MRSLLPEAWSYSALNQFLRICGAQYLFQRVEGIEPEVESPNVVLGSALHHAASFMRYHQKLGKPIVLDDAREVFVEGFDVLASNPIVRFEEGEAAAMREDGLKYVALLHANLGSEEVVAVEQDFVVPLVDPITGEELKRPLKGVMDVVLRDSHGLLVADVKSAATRYSGSRIAVDLQATAYAYAASRLWRTEGGARFAWDLIVKRTRSPFFERVYASRDERDFARLIALVKTAERAIEAGVFVPSDGSFYCAGCGFKKACAAWSERQLMPLTSGRAVA
jgi:CRISPR/Cas system-associated exonuclease Cas4 (RecB family)